VGKIIKMAIDRDKVLDCLKKVSGECNDFIKSGLEVSNEPAFYDRLATYFLFVKSTKTYQSIIVLIENKKYEDAQVLLRSLVENQIVLMWLQSKGSVGYLKFWRYEIISKLKQHHKSLWETLTRRDSTEFDYLKAQVNAEETLKTLDNKIKELDNSYHKNKQEEYDKKNWWAGININEMAKELSKLSNNADWKWKYNIPFDETSHYIHPNPVVISDFLKIDDNIIKPNYDEHPDSFLESSLAAHIMLEMADNFNTLFNLNKKNIVVELRNDLDAIFIEN
jgi:hypothetical protein